MGLDKPYRKSTEQLFKVKNERHCTCSTYIATKDTFPSSQNCNKPVTSPKTSEEQTPWEASLKKKHKERKVFSDYSQNIYIKHPESTASL